jgi:prepilin-type N-terminal cleavage/methylation domain-containing protein
MKNGSIRKTLEQRSDGFTLLELLVSIGILGLLCCMVMPAFARTGSQSRTVGCLNSHRQLWAAWRMYADDNSDKVIYNMGVAETQAEVNQATYRNWANNVMDWTVSNGLNTNRPALDKGLMGQYLRSNYTAYKCPADTYLSPAQVAANWTARTRSLSMNAFFGLFSSSASDPTVSGRNWAFSNYRQWLKIAEVLKPTSTWLFIDEHPDSINDGYYLNNPAASSWQDLPGSYHDGAVTLSFVDGRGETHKWLSNTSVFRIGFTYPIAPVFDNLGQTDFQWLLTRSGVLY